MLAATRVEVVPDPLTYVTAVATVLAAVLALVAIIYTEILTRRERKANEAAAVAARIEAARDRRIQWELSILAELSRQHSETGVPHLAGYVKALIRHDAPADDLPLLRHYTKIHPTPEGEEKARVVHAAAVGKVKDGVRNFLFNGEYERAVSQEVGPEIVDAINRRLP